MKTITRVPLLVMTVALGLGFALSARGQVFNSPYLQTFNPPFPGVMGENYLGWMSPPGNNSGSGQMNVANVVWTNFDGSPVMNMRNRQMDPGTGQRLPSYLISPEVSITDADAVISWVETAASNFWSGPKVSPRNLYVTTDGTNWTLVDSYTSGDMPDSFKGEGWRRMTYSLAPYVGETVRWKWEILSTNPEGSGWEYTYWCIDNVYLGSESGSILTSNPASIDFGAVLSWEMPEMTVILRNNGPSPITLEGLTLEGSGAFFLTQQPEAYPVSINGYLGGSGFDLVAVKIGFSPVSPVSEAGQLVVHHNGTSTVLPLSGSGILATEAVLQAKTLSQFNCSPSPDGPCLAGIFSFQGEAYRYTPNYPARVRVSSCHPYNRIEGLAYSYDTYLAVFKGLPSDPTVAPFLANDDQEGNCTHNRAASAVELDIDAGETIYIFWPKIFPMAPGASNDFYFTVEVLPLGARLEAEFSADQTVIQPGGSVNFTDETLGAPTQWSWEFPGSLQGGSNLQNPSGITYPESGNYLVKMTVHDGTLNSVISKSAYIVVGAENTETIPGGSEDFGMGGLKSSMVTASSGSWTFTDLNGKNLNWEIRNTGVGGCFTSEGPMPSTTGTGGFLVLAADEYNCPKAEKIGVDAFAQSPSFDCSDYDVVIYTFQQRFRIDGTDPLMELQVSNDGGYNWKAYDLLKGRSTETTWGDPVEVVQVNITESAARQSDVRVRFYWKGSVNYFWMVDDIEVLGIKACEDLDVAISGTPLVYLGYEQLSTSVLTAEVEGGLGPYQFIWSTGETTPSILVKPVETTTYYLEVIDVQGCVTTTQFTVQVEDVRCGKNLDKVLMCKKGKGAGSKSGTVCVEPSSVQDLLKAGATLGSCNKADVFGLDEEVTEYPVAALSVFPNPGNGRFNLELTGFTDELVLIQVKDIVGRVVHSERVANPDLRLVHSIELDGQGIYFVEATSSYRKLVQQVTVIR